MEQEQQQDHNDLIRNRAHQIWEAAGRQDGEHEHHWQRAMQELGLVSPVDQPLGSALPEAPEVQKKRTAPKGA